MADAIVKESKGQIELDYKDFEEIKQGAIIPVMNGVAGAVLEALQNRIGKSSLSISAVATDVDFSKRTLQRRLHDQNISYASLRDIVRFNKAIKCLLIDNMGIEETSDFLDFTDRTSFTNAFKRWTDLSPSMFRKLYRDYV